MTDNEKTYDQRKCVIRDGKVCPVPDDEEDYHGTMLNARFDPETNSVRRIVRRSNGRVYTHLAGRRSEILVFPRIYY